VLASFWEKVVGSTPWTRAMSVFWSSVRALRSCQSSGTAKVTPTVGAVIAWWPAGTEGAALPEALALGRAVASALLDVVAVEVEAVAPAEPADEGLLREQPARARTALRARTAGAALMSSPG
jgi:hypothetical protein